MQLPIPEFKVLLYGPDLPPAGIKARAHFEDSVLVVQGKGHWFTIQGERLNLKTGGFDGRQWLLSWLTPAGLMTAMLQGEDAAQAFIKLAPPEISEQLKRLHSAIGGRSRLLRIGMALLALLLVLSVIAVGVFQLYAGEISQWAANRVSQAQKAELGERAFEQLRPSLKLVERGIVRETVEFIGVRVSTGSRNRYVFHVAESAENKVLTLPGGHVVINTGSLRTVKNSNELAALLAHAASHGEKRHALSNILSALGWRAVLAAAMGDFSNSVWQGMGPELAALQFSEEQKREADSEALTMLQRAGVASDGLLALLERLAEYESAILATEKPGILPLSSAGVARIEALRKQISEQRPYHSNELSIDWPQFERVLSP